MRFMKITSRARVNKSHSCHSSIREIRDKNVPEFTVKIPPESRMTRINEFHECPCVGIRVTLKGGI